MCKNKRILISDICVCAICIAFLVYAVVLLLVLPFPERTRVEDMDSLMIHSGEAFALISYCVSVPFIIATFITSLGLTSALFYRLFVSDPSNNFSFSSNSTRNWFRFGAILSIIIPPLFIWFILAKLFLLCRTSADSCDYQHNRNSQIWKRIIIWPMIIFYPLVAVSAILFTQKKKLYYNSIPVRTADLKESYTLSRDKQNTIVLFFDRAFGSHVYKLLALDYCYFNKENGIINQNGTSFAELFPEFTYYINSLSASDNTNGSVPTIEGSWNFDTPIKDTTLINPKTNVVNNSIGQSQWLLDSRMTAYQMLGENKYSNIASVGFPYYGNTTWQHNSNSGELQSKIREKLNNDNINIFDETEAAKSLDKNISYGIEDDMRIIRNFGANKKSVAGIIQKDKSIKFAPDDLNTNKKYLDNPYGANEQLDLSDNKEHINLSVNPNKSSAYIMLHTGVTHEPYSHISDKNFINEKYNIAGINYDNPSVGTVEGPTSRKELKSQPKDDIFFSEWWMLQKIKDILIYLKNLPYTGSDSYIQNQYDNTNVYVVSDHGSLINNDVDSYNNKINRELLKNGLITEKNYNEQLEIANETGVMQKCSNIFFRKPRKSSDAKLNKPTSYSNNKDYLKNLFDFETFISSADLMPIIEGDIKRVSFESSSSSSAMSKFVFNDNESYYKETYADSNPDMTGIDKQAYDALLKGVLVPNPLGADNKDILYKRQFTISFAGNWKHMPNAKNYSVKRIYKIDQTKLKKGSNSFVYSSYLNPDIYRMIYEK